MYRWARSGPPNGTSIKRAFRSAYRRHEPGPLLTHSPPESGANSRYILPIRSDAMYLDTHGHDGDEAQKERTMFERFTDRPPGFIALPKKEPRTRASHRVGTEHILLGLIQEREGIAFALLESRGSARRWFAGRWRRSLARGRARSR